MHNITQMNSLPQKQQGATLIVALILLVLISLIGVSTLKNATVVEKMASASYQKSITFSASESAVDLSLQDDTLISEVIREKVTVPREDVDINVDNATADIDLIWVGSGPVEGASIGPDGIAGQRIMITSTGSLAAGGTQSTTTVHGVVQLTPGG